MIKPAACLLLFLLLGAPTLAQTAPRQPDQYCGLQTAFKGRERYKLTLLTGMEPAKIQQVEEAAYIKSIENEYDALNYLSSHGWEVIGMTAEPGGTRYHLRRPTRP